jgi:hypothetical protein
MVNDINRIFKEYCNIYGESNCKLNTYTRNDGSVYYNINTPRMFTWCEEDSVFDINDNRFIESIYYQKIVDNLIVKYATCTINDFYIKCKFDNTYAILFIGYGVSSGSCNEKRVGDIKVYNINTEQISFKTLYEDKKGIYFKSKDFLPNKRYLDNFNKDIAICIKPYYEIKE